MDGDRSKVMLSCSFKEARVQVGVASQYLNIGITMYRILIFISIIVQVQHRFHKAVAFVVSRNANLQSTNHIDRSVLYKNPTDGDNDISISEDSDASSSAFEEMRRLLENSWNMPTMGRIPTTPENAVDECVDAMKRLVQENKVENNDNNIFFIDILLPQYDISYGDRIYDEIYTTEFCTRFVQQLQIPTVIVYRDHTTVNTISRILNSRSDLNRNDKSEYRNENIVDSTPLMESDDFDPEAMQNDDPTIADFRKSLMQSWDTAKSTVDERNTVIPDEEKIPVEPDEEQQQQSSLYYRIGSLFGNATISKGADMIEDVMMAVQMNDGLPLEHEQMMIIVSPFSKEEMYAIRAIVDKYNRVVKDRKLTIVFFNCKLQPIPQEIIRGQTVYSILPLVGSRKDISSLSASRSQTQPKVVVLCRYPYDWQVYVDLGQGDVGFYCIASISVQDVKLNRLTWSIHGMDSKCCTTIHEPTTTATTT